MVMNIPRLIRQLQEAHYGGAFNGEWWIDDGGRVLYADGDHGDYNHEGHVIEILCGRLREAAGMEPTDQDDPVTCRTQIGDYLDEQGLDIDEAYETIWAALDKVEGAEAGAMARGLLGGRGDSLDAREYAIRFWGWIRVAGSELEMRDFSPATLKRAGSGLAEILWENGNYEEPDEEFGEGSAALPLVVSIYGSRERISTTLGDLEAGQLRPDMQAALDAQTRNARAQVQRMDHELEPDFYRQRQGGGVL